MASQTTEAPSTVSRPSRIILARETLKIITQRFYMSFPHLSIDTKVDLSRFQTHTEDQTQFHDCSPSAFQAQSSRLKYDTKVAFEQSTTIYALYSLPRDGHIGLLSYASATKPGGGFLTGSMAQEESLAYASGIYGSLMTEKGKQFYEVNGRAIDKAKLEEKGRNNKKHTKDSSNSVNSPAIPGIYAHTTILSPSVPFFRDDSGKLISSPRLASVITCPAVNAGVVRQRCPAEVDVDALIVETMKERMSHALWTFLQPHPRFKSVDDPVEEAACETIILGAFGCGVFRNDIKVIGRLWAELLGRDGPYEGCFKEVIFAVPEGDRVEVLRTEWQKFNKSET